MFRSLLAWLASLAADPSALESEQPRAAAAVMVAAATLEKGLPDTPRPSPVPTPDSKCCDDCKGSGVVVHGDGHKTACACAASCECKRK